MWFQTWLINKYFFLLINEYNESHWGPKLYWTLWYGQKTLNHSSKYLLLGSTDLRKEISHTWVWKYLRWVNKRILIFFSWIFPLKHLKTHLKFFWPGMKNISFVQKTWLIWKIQRCVFVKHFKFKVTWNVQKQTHKHTLRNVFWGGLGKAVQQVLPLTTQLVGQMFRL